MWQRQGIWALLCVLKLLFYNRNTCPVKSYLPQFGQAQTLLLRTSQNKRRQVFE